VREPELVYGAQMNLTNVIAGLREVVGVPASVASDAGIALLDDTGRAVAGSLRAGQKPLVTSEVGHALPHWRVALYLNDPAALTRNARPLALMLSLIVVMMVAVIAIGGALIATDLNRQLRLARQKTDFVSNVSHELKTPLTSIRMFSEMLADEKVSDPAQRKQFLTIISAEAARLTRLINNVLDFARMERGEKKYHFERCDLNAIARDTVAAFRPQLESKGFEVKLSAAHAPVFVHGDCDALAQVLVNLLSNAEKYSADGREVSVEVSAPAGACAELRVLDRGPGVPRGAEEKIFEQFFRAHDSLSSGIQGSGLGLTLARQIVRAHDGDIRYARREEGGSVFTLQLPQSS
jgi:signal transduction histidine kinase